MTERDARRVSRFSFAAVALRERPDRSGDEAERGESGEHDPGPSVRTVGPGRDALPSQEDSGTHDDGGTAPDQAEDRPGRESTPYYLSRGEKRQDDSRDQRCRAGRAVGGHTDPSDGRRQ